MASLFANLNNTQKSNYSGLFGGSTTGAPSSSGASLFSSPSTTTAASAPPATSSNFPGASTATAAPTSASPFPSLGGTTSAPTMSGALFSSSLNNTASGTTTAPPTSGGLYSNLTNTASSNYGGLFSKSSAAPTTTAAPAAHSSLFGKLGTAAQSTTSAPGNTLQPFSSSSFGVSNPNFASNSIQADQQNKPTEPRTAYFDSILDQSRKRGHTESFSDDLPQLQLGLGDLRSRIKKIGGGTSSQNGATGRAHYLLAASGVDPGAAIRDLQSFTSATQRLQPQSPIETPDTDVETYLANLQKQTTLNMIEDGLARSIQDFDTFLEENVTMEWDAQRKRIYEHFGIKPKEASSPGTQGTFAASMGDSLGGFGRSRRSKAAALSGSRFGTSNGGSKFGRSSMQRPLIGAAGPVGVRHNPIFPDVEKKMELNNIQTTGPQDRSQRDRESRYAKKIQELNLARLSDDPDPYPYPVCTEFSEVVLQSSESYGTDLGKAYRALVEIVGEKPEIKVSSDPRAAREGKFWSESLKSESRILKNSIIRGATRCLEKLAFEQMEDVIFKNPREANLGGIPNIINKVKAYVRLQAGRKNLAGDNSDLQMLGDDYVWALIYSLLRTGHVTEANQYVTENASAFRAIDRSFPSYIGAYTMSEDRRLDNDLQQRINNEYNQRSRIAPDHSIDPYRMACYKIIGRCDLSKRIIENVPQNVEDFAWIQLVLARELKQANIMASESYGLAGAQAVIKEVGNKYFTKGGADMGNSFGTFVFLQVAVGLFEDAVSYLYTYSYVDAVHLAIALNYYGLLRLSDPTAGIEELYSLGTDELPQISFGPMVALYTRDFRSANAGAAVDYLSLLCLNQDVHDAMGQRHIAFCHEALRELVLESREFAELLGDMRGDGQRMEGVIEQRSKLIGLHEPGEFYRTITLHAASQADDNGRVTDAVLLYHLAGEYDNVVVAMNRALSQVIHTPIGQAHDKLEPLKPRASNPDQSHSLSLVSMDDPVQLATSIVQIYDGKPMFRSKIKDVNWAGLRCLLDMQKVKGMIESGDWSGALDRIDQLAIIPIKAHGDAAMVRRYVMKFQSLPEPVANTIPVLLFWSISCGNRERAHLLSSEYGGNEGIKRTMLENLTFMNMDLTTYTSQMRYRLPAHLLEALARAQTE